MWVAVSGVSTCPACGLAVVVWWVLVEGESVAPADRLRVYVGCSDDGVAVGLVAACVVCGCHALDPWGASTVVNVHGCIMLIGRLQALPAGLSCDITASARPVVARR